MALTRSTSAKGINSSPIPPNNATLSYNQSHSAEKSRKFFIFTLAAEEPENESELHESGVVRQYEDASRLEVDTSDPCGAWQTLSATRDGAVPRIQLASILPTLTRFSATCEARAATHRLSCNYRSSLACQSITWQGVQRCLK